ncbi:MAG: MBOAT family protein [Bacteroidales bacterium]|nr:MBOAT family protein [Bacteroidales bacterium]
MSMNRSKIQEVFVYDPGAPLLFNSGTFLVLFLCFYGIFILTRRQKVFRTTYTVLFSIFFYYKSSGIFFWILIFSTLTGYLIGQQLYFSRKPLHRKLLLIAGLVLNLGILSWFKYTRFLLEIWESLSGLSIHKPDIFLPVGISFFTFQTLSYLIDLYRRKIEPAKNVMDFAFFVCFFPQLVAGPIVRAGHFIPQIYQKLQISLAGLGRAWWLILSGLIKKAVISDYISINFVDRVFSSPELYTGLENLVAVYGYAIQIYCDFSGYSDIAIGLALLMGFNLPDNFRSPYKAVSMTDFWRRWHISLSTWLRDYLYIPLGGNRKGKGRTYINLMITMLLGGLWHGASWKFVIWGGLHGAVLAFEKLLNTFFRVKPGRFNRIAGWFITFHLVCLGWVFFRASDYHTGMAVLHKIGELSGYSMAKNIFLSQLPVFGLILLGLLTHFTPGTWKTTLQHSFIRLPMPMQAVFAALVIWIVLQTATSQVQPYIYFQF